MTSASAPALRVFRHLWLYVALVLTTVPILALWALLFENAGARLAGLVLGVPATAGIMLLLMARSAYRLEVLRSALPDAIVVPLMMQAQDWLFLAPTPRRPRQWFRRMTTASFDDFGVTLWEGGGRPSPTCEIPWSAVTEIAAAEVVSDDGSHSPYGIFLALAGEDGQAVRFALVREGALFGFKQGLPYPADVLRGRVRERWGAAAAWGASEPRPWRREEHPSPTRPRQDRVRPIERPQGPPVLRDAFTVGPAVLGATWVGVGVLVVCFTEGAWRWVFGVLLLLIVLCQGILLALLLATRWSARDGELRIRRATGWESIRLSSISSVEITRDPSIPAMLWMVPVTGVWYGLEVRLHDGTRVPMPELFGSAARCVAMADSIEALLPNAPIRAEAPRGH
ncbi:hypothetical protein [Agrococcus carbonis]|uniref:PH domain-containing protein n=1 Tax=Agrococcus carbonis TaxID=684552 RepID=A0A1H1L9Y1_9MICO|nr:hypothetical protein [Agrococcus carbonis]SDR71421.1 hypothetical protein SAMN04489719_0500 [Agrococcus carbonis]